MRPGRYIYNMKKKHLTQSFDSLIAKPPTPQWAQIGKKVQQIMDFSVVAGFFQRVKSTFFSNIFFSKISLERIVGEESMDMIMAKMTMKLIILKNMMMTQHFW